MTPEAGALSISAKRHLHDSIHTERHGATGEAVGQGPPALQGSLFGRKANDRKVQKYHHVGMPSGAPDPEAKSKKTASSAPPIKVIVWVGHGAVFRWKERLPVATAAAVHLATTPPLLYPEDGTLNISVNINSSTPTNGARQGRGLAPPLAQGSVDGVVLCNAPCYSGPDFLHALKSALVAKGSIRVSPRVAAQGRAQTRIRKPVGAGMG